MLHNPITVFAQTTLVTIFGLLLIATQNQYDAAIIPPLDFGLHYAGAYGLISAPGSIINTTTNPYYCSGTLNCAAEICALTSPIFVGMYTGCAQPTTSSLTIYRYYSDAIFLAYVACAMVGCFMLVGVWNGLTRALQKDPPSRRTQNIIQWSFIIFFVMSKVFIIAAQWTYVGFRSWYINYRQDPLPSDLSLSLIGTVIGYQLLLVWETLVSWSYLNSYFRPLLYEELDD